MDEKVDWDLNSSERIDKIYEVYGTEFVSVLENIHKQLNQVNGSACENKDIFTVEAFIQGMERNLETIRNSNSVTHESYVKMAERVKWINAVLGLIGVLIGTGCGAGVGGKMSGVSTEMFWTLLKSKELQQMLFDAAKVVREEETNSKEEDIPREDVTQYILDQFKSRVDPRAISATDRDELLAKVFGVPLKSDSNLFVEYGTQVCTGHSSEELAVCLAISEADYLELESILGSTISVNENTMERCVSSISNMSFRKVLEYIVEYRSRVLDDLKKEYENAVKEYNNDMSDVKKRILEILQSRVVSNAPSAENQEQLLSKAFVPRFVMHSNRFSNAFVEKVRERATYYFTGYSLNELAVASALSQDDYAKLEKLIERKFDVKLALEKIKATYEANRDQVTAFFSKILKIPGLGMYIAAIASISISIFFAAASFQLVGIKKRNLIEANEKLNAEKHMESIAQSYRDLLQAFETFFNVSFQDSVNATALNCAWMYLDLCIRSTRKEVNYVTDLYNDQIDFAQKDGQDSMILLHTFRYFGVGSVVVGTAILTGGASVVAASSALGVSAAAASSAVVGSAVASTGSGVFYLFASSEFGECEAGFRKIQLCWQEKLANLRFHNELVLVPLLGISNKLETIGKLQKIERLQTVS
mmetsp:Transcript_826/g.1556  ORF Transcript_826/g.1556 Transcript_826/m.1556 type:complete len:647 (-) Transcript_826:1243-3183(-)